MICYDSYELVWFDWILNSIRICSSIPSHSSYMLTFSLKIIPRQMPILWMHHIYWWLYQISNWVALRKLARNSRIFQKLLILHVTQCANVKDSIVIVLFGAMKPLLEQSLRAWERVIVDWENEKAYLSPSEHFIFTIALWWRANIADEAILTSTTKNRGKQKEFPVSWYKFLRAFDPE